MDTSNTSVEGVGIGLSIVKDLVSQMNGRVGFESVLGEGSTSLEHALLWP